MHPDPPRFVEAADPEADARWEAYQALMRRRGLPPPGSLPAQAGGDPDRASTAEPAEPDDEPPLRDMGSTAPPPRRNARFIVATMALTAGIILAATLVQRPPPEPTVAPARAASPPARPTPVARPPTQARAAVSAPPTTTLAAEAPPGRVRGVHDRPQDQTPQCWTTELSTGLDPRSLVREARLVNCPLPW